MRIRKLAPSVPLAAALSACLLLPGCIIVDGKPYGLDFGGHEIHGSGIRAEEDRALDDFQAVRLSLPAEVEVRVGEPTAFSISGDDDLLEHVTTDVVGGELVIDIPRRYRFRKTVEIRIATPSLERFEVEGSGDVRIRGVSGQRFVVSIEGSGEVTAAGTVGRLDASIEGSGDLKLQELQAAEAKVSIEGSGGIRVHATDALDYRIEGSGNIRYSGSPAVSGGISGSGSVRHGG